MIHPNEITMKALKLIPLVAVLFASCAKEEITVPTQNQPVTPSGSYQFYNINVTDAAQFVGEINGVSTDFIAGQDGVDNVASVSYTGNNSTLATEFTVRENGVIIGKLVIAKRYMNKNSLTDSASVRNFFATGNYTYATENSTNGIVITYIDQNNKVWTSKGENTNSVFAIKNIKTAVTNPCQVVTYEVKTKIDLGCKLYNNGNSISFSGSAIGQFAVAN